MPKSDIAWAVREIRSRADSYQTCQDYYDGEHPLLFATEKFRNAFGTLFREFADNLCPSVVDAVADRLRITGWSSSTSKSAPSSAQDLWDKWRLNRIAAQVHRTAPMKGDAYVMVWPNSVTGQPVFWPHEPDCAAVRYDDIEDPGKVELGAKLWQDDDQYYRCTLYYEDHIERYRTISKVPSAGAPEADYRWSSLGTQPNQWGVIPLFHFGNRAEIGCCGVSELKDAIPVQNALNKSICDLLVSMEFVAMPQRYATGLQVEVDEDTGKPKNPPFTPGVDRIWTAGENVAFGQFPQADLAKFLEVNDSFRLEMARITGTPPHFMSLEKAMPSGEALKVAEGRLIKKVEATTMAFSPVWVDLMRLAAHMDDETGIPDDDYSFTPVWGAASPHNPLLDSETQLVKQQVGVSKHQSLRELGYSDDEIENMMEEARQEAADDAAAKMQAAQAALLGPNGLPLNGKQTQDPSGRPTAFNRNGSPGVASKPGSQANVTQEKQPVYGGVPVPLPRAGRGQWADN